MGQRVFVCRGGGGNVCVVVGMEVCVCGGGGRVEVVGQQRGGIEADVDKMA